MSMSSIDLAFAKTLKQLRRDKRLTQEELAQRAGLDYKYLQKLEGKAPSSPTLSTLEKLAKGLDISLTELISLLDEWRS
ncbi:helix-turn-helix domain-containing protein [Mailhella massiliensis]|uniref:helix-turn-helix domain-containing protein n=2 Tax=Mailhella massiliensis TaxID=1903261 RepID=UPI0013900835|nr:helix-turn-helix transcriptional regulator [Mailhella massiliensis]